MELVSIGSSQGANIYVCPGGKLILTGKDWAGNLNGFLTDDKPSNLYIYNGGSYTGSYTSASKTGLYIEGNASIGDATLGGKVRVGGTLTAGALETNNCDFQAGSVKADSWEFTNNSKVAVEELIAINGDFTINAQNDVNCKNLTVGGDFWMENVSELTATEHIEVAGNFEDSTQGIINTPCLYVGGDLLMKNDGTLNVPNYIHCENFTALASGFKIYMGGDALIYCEDGDFKVENKDWTIEFKNTADAMSAIVANKFYVMEGDAAYIHGYAKLSASEYWDKPSTNFQYYNGEESSAVNRQEYETQGTVEVKSNSVTVQSDPTSCTPKFNAPTTQTPPTDTELISTITHTHDVSATCIALNADKTKAYLSWQKRGTSIHGCLEALVVENDMAKLTSFMECDDDDVEGGDNWNGNSAVSGADENGEHQGQFDFNHLIVADGHVVSVGDNANMGGFIGAIALDGNGDFGESLAVNGGFFARQLLASAEGNVARSGNTVAYSNGKYYIACAGGFQEYVGNIADLSVWNAYKNPSDPTKLGYWQTKLGNYTKTEGSAKHIAISGDKVATLELVSRPTTEGDYWFNDTETAIDGVLKVTSTSNWMGAATWTANIPAISPVYGKNVVAFDGDNVYVCAGKQGLQVWSNGEMVRKFDNTNATVVEVLGKSAKGAAANGVAIDDSYVYVAFGTGGVWILKKSDLSVVSWFVSQGATNFGSDFVSEANVAAANYIALDGTYIYVAYGRHGIKVLKRP